MSGRASRVAAWTTWSAAAWPVAYGALAAVSPLRRLYDRAWYEVPGVAAAWLAGHGSPRMQVLSVATALGATVLCAAPPVGAIVGAMRGGYRRQLRPATGQGAADAPVRATSALHGDADWLGEREMRRLAARPLPEWGGVIYGAALRPDLHPGDDGGEAPLLVSAGESDAVNGLVFGGMGAGKTSGVFVPTLVHPRGWKGNVLANDPAGQLAALCTPALETEGRAVKRVGFGRVGFDLFAALDPAAPDFEADVHAFVEAMGRPMKDSDRSDANGVFKEMARNMVAALLADLLADPATPPRDRTPRGLIARLALPERDLRGLLERIHFHSPSPFARDMAAPMWDAHQKPFSSYYADAMADLKWLTVRRNADLVSDTGPGAVRAADFVGDNADVCAFLNLGAGTMLEYPQIGRAIFTAVLRRVTRDERRLPRPLLLPLDERILLGNLPALNTAWTQSRKWGVLIVEAWHSVALMRETVGKGLADAMQAGAAFESYAAMDDATAKEVSAWLGKYTVLAPSESSGTSSGGGGGATGGSNRNTSTSLQARPLATPDELLGLPSGWGAVRVRGAGRPVLCRQARYYLRPELDGVVPQDAYAAPAAA